MRSVAEALYGKPCLPGDDRVALHALVLRKLDSRGGTQVQTTDVIGAGIQQRYDT